MKNIQVKPEYGDAYVYMEVNTCKGCGRTAYYVTMSRYDPCPQCGCSSFYNNIARWIPPKRTWYGKITKAGYWELKDNG